MADSSKTEKATPKKRRDERKKGNVFLSQDAVAVATLVGACATFFLLSSMIATEIGQYLAFCIQRCGMQGSTDEILSDLMNQGIAVVFKTALPGLLVTALCGVAATFAQTRLLVSKELLKPKFNRINPIEGFKRLFSIRSIVEALKGILKITILIVIIYISLKGFLGESYKYLYTDISAACVHMLGVGRNMVIWIVVAFAALAAGDFLYQWRHHERELRMSKQEIKEEYKQTEGDPQIKGKIKEMQRRRAQSRMMQQVPGADVVIRNPTHFAVALRYRPDVDAAPIVLAKGQDELALRIVKVAEDAGVAVMENVPLARALYAATEINQEIPQELYSAVAEVLVYIFKLNDEKKIVK